jgi:transcription initiation factor TFIIB
MTQASDSCLLDSMWSLFDAFQSDKAEDGDRENSEGQSDTDIACKCEFCKKHAVILMDGQYTCRECHAVNDRYIDTGAEWRYYGYDDNKSGDPSRCGLPTSELLPESSLGTIIGNKAGDCYEMRILRKYQMWNSMTYKERTLYNVFDTLTVNAVNNGIPTSIIDEAKMLYKKISEMKISRGDNRSGLIASSIYMSCKTNNVPRSAKEIAKIFNLKTTTMTRGCKKFQEILQMDLASSTASDFIMRFCSKLNLDKHVKDVCLHVVRVADEMSIVCSQTPPSVAAGCIYLVCNMCGIKVDKKTLAEACDTSIVTISKCYKKLYVYRMNLFSDAMKLKYSIK